jgi:hypothetical protein
LNVLTVFAHPNPQSFCHAVLDRFDAYAVHGADDATRRGYLERAYIRGRQF